MSKNPEIPTPESDWAIRPGDALIIQSNYWGMHVDVCSWCGSLVPTDFKNVHELSHMAAGTGSWRAKIGVCGQKDVNRSDPSLECQLPFGHAGRHFAS